ncbi:hypothetical protein H4Q26_010283 [Puccinia striiformis f. sp. tritici PST-130]|nr:hypothetical protein H4Q26_010283 [Puccinia striiformis f. sp. tritici PST-130]
MDPQFVQQLQSCLEQIAHTEWYEGIKAATQALNDQFYRSPLAIPGLFEILTTCGTPAVRQLSAVELRKRVLPANENTGRNLDHR